MYVHWRKHGVDLLWSSKAVDVALGGAKPTGMGDAGNERDGRGTGGYTIAQLGYGDHDLVVTVLRDGKWGPGKGSGGINCGQSCTNG